MKILAVSVCGALRIEAYDGVGLCMRAETVTLHMQI